MSTIASLFGLSRVRLLRAVLPQDCLLCGAEASIAPVCDPCREDLPTLARACPACAMPNRLGETCGSCLRRPPSFDATFAIWRYEYPVDRLVQALKFRGKLALAPFFASALRPLIERPNSEQVDILIPMPLHPKRLTERGFNQAAEIARCLTASTNADKTSPRIASRGASRVRPTLAQARLPFDQRAGNVRGAFACDLDLKGARVAVLDDVMTTGATLAELAKVLKRAGAARVENWVVARTID